LDSVGKRRGVDMQIAQRIAVAWRNILSLGQLAALVWIGFELHSIAASTGGRDPAVQEQADVLQSIDGRLAALNRTLVISGR